MVVDDVSKRPPRTVIYSDVKVNTKLEFQLIFAGLADVKRVEIFYQIFWFTGPPVDLPICLLLL